MRREVPVRFGEGLGVKFPRATRLTVMAKFIGDQLRSWIEDTLEGRFGLMINRAKTSVKRVSPATDKALDFLGYRIWHIPSRFARGCRYLTAHPSPKAMAAEREKIREIICPRMGMVPIPILIDRVNRQMQGWAAYHRKGRPSRCFFLMNRFVSNRLFRHLRRRSQRPYRLPVGMTWWDHLTNDLGFVPLRAAPAKANS